MNILAIICAAFARVAFVPVIIACALVASGSIETLIEHYETVTGSLQAITDAMELKK